MALEILGGPLRVPRLANASGSIAILIADSILVSRLLDKKTSSLLIECGRRGDAMYIGSETHWSLEGSLFWYLEKLVRRSPCRTIVGSIDISIDSAHSDLLGPQYHLGTTSDLHHMPLFLDICGNYHHRNVHDCLQDYHPIKAQKGTHKKIRIYYTNHRGVWIAVLRDPLHHSSAAGCSRLELGWSERGSSCVVFWGDLDPHNGTRCMFSAQHIY